VERLWYYLPEITSGKDRLFSRSTFYKLVKEKKLTPKKLRGRTIVTAEELRRVLDSLPEGLAPPPIARRKLTDGDG
jgi:hypothetical protein